MVSALTTARQVRDTSAASAVIGEAGFTIKDPQRFANHFGRFILEENERFNNQAQFSGPIFQQSGVQSPRQGPSSLLLRLALQAQQSNNPPIRFPGPETEEEFVLNDERKGRRLKVSEKLVVNTPRSIFSRPAGHDRDSILKQFKDLASRSPLLSTPLPNLPAQPRRIQNPLLQTLFQNDNLHSGRNPLFQQSGKGGEELQRELLEKQREIEMMLDERNEKERLLIEALRKQSAERQGPAILALTPRTTTPTTTTTATTRSTTTTVTTTARQEVEEFSSSAVVEEEIEEEDYKVEIILEMTRGLVEATHQQRLNRSEERNEFSEELFGKSFPEKAEKVGTPLEAIVNARDAVVKTMRSGNERTSPAVWAAVEILSDFVDSQQPGIPSDVLIAIIQLTEFLNAEDIKEDGEDGGEETVKAVVEVQQRFIPSTTTEKQILLSPLQIKLRDKLLKQKVMKQQEINKIIERSKQKNRPTSSSSRKFPTRINLMGASSDSQQFSFSTLPIY